MNGFIAGLRESGFIADYLCEYTKKDGCNDRCVLRISLKKQ